MNVKSGDAISSHTVAEATRAEVTLSNGAVVVLREEGDRLVVTSNSGAVTIHPVMSNRVAIGIEA